MSAKTESRIGCAIIAGLAMIVLGVVLTIMLYGAGAARMAQSQGKDPGMLLVAVFGPLTIIAGILTVGGSVFYGIYRGRGATDRAILRVVPGVRILARFAMNRGSDELLFSEFDFNPDAPGFRFFVRLQRPDGGSEEVRCPYEVFQTCGEGMTGTAEIQGDWLGCFVREPARETS